METFIISVLIHEEKIILPRVGQPVLHTDQPVYSNSSVGLFGGRDTCKKLESAPPDPCLTTSLTTNVAIIEEHFRNLKGGGTT